MNGDAGTDPGTSTEDTSPPVGIQEAAARLGVSVNTVRRWVKDGRLRSERMPRPQGYTVVVHLSNGETDDHQQVPPHVPTQEVPHQGDGLARAEAMIAYNRQLLEPVMQHVEQLPIRLEALARDNGDLAAENRVLRAALAERPAAEPSRRPRWAFWRG
jgi:excisionase family DNA binding protein